MEEKRENDEPEVTDSGAKQDPGEKASCCHLRAEIHWPQCMLVIRFINII